MSERASVTQAVQIGVEAVPGDGAAANLILNSLTIEPGVKVDMQRFRPTGQKLESIISVGKEWVAFKVKGLGSYTELQYLLAGVLGDNSGVASQPSADGGAELWKFILSARDVDTVQTYSFEQGNSDHAHKFAYGLLTGVGLTFTRSEVSVDGDGIAHKLTDGVMMTATPSSIREQPILPAEVDVYLDSTFANLGTTKLLRDFKAEFKLGDKAGPVWTLNSAETSFATHVEKAPKCELKLLVEADTAGMGILTTMRAGSTVFVRVQATGPDAAPGKPYQLKLDGSYKVADVSEFKDEDGVYAIEYTLAAVYDAASGLGFEATLRNREISLAPPVS